MNRIILNFLAVLIISVLATDADVCLKHPMRNHTLKGFDIVNKGLSCFFEEQSNCFTSFKNELVSYYNDTPTAVAEGKEVICGKIENHCLLENQISEIRSKYHAFISTYRNVLKDLFAYKVAEDKTVDDILKTIADKIKGISKYIPQDFVDDLVVTAKDALVDVFEELKTQVDNLSEHYEPLLNAVEEFSAGQFCFAADADYAKYIDGNTNAVRVSTDAFEAIAASISSFKMEQLDVLITDLRNKILELWKKISTTGYALADMAIDSLLPLKDYLENEFKTDKLFLVGDVTELQKCFFPAEGESACVPFVDDILALIERMKKLFNGDFKGFMDTNKVQLESIEDETLLLMRQSLLSMSTLTNSDSYEIMWVTGTGNNVYSFLETAKEAPKDLQPTKPSSPNDNTSGSDVPLYVYVGGGALALLLIIWISCLIACCCRKPKQAAYPMMMNGNMGSYSSIPNSLPMNSMQGSMNQPMYM